MRSRSLMTLTSLAALSVSLGLLPGVAVAAGNSGALPAPTTPAAARQVAAAAGVPLPPIPVVDRAFTAGQDPAVLLSQAIKLVTANVKAIPLQTSLSGLQATLDGDRVRSAQASMAARAAHSQSARAAQAAAELNASATSLGAALRQATLSLYMSGRPSGLPDIKSGNADAVMAAVIGEQVALSPRGILGERKQALANAEAQRAKAQAAEKTADAAASIAEETSMGASEQVDTMRGELSSLGAAAAATLQAESMAVAQQAGQDLAGSSSLEFTPVEPIPDPVATTTVALTWLFSELGKPYVYGATGPATFDCSGLTQFVWNKAGVAIPRVAVDQDYYTIPVPLSELRPGDLVFFGADVHHVGMYIGGGLMINAPHTGTVVQVSSIWWSDLIGFGRVHMPGVPVPSRAPIPASAPAVLPTLGAVPSQRQPPPGVPPVTSPTTSAPTLSKPTTPTSSSSSSTTAPTTTAPTTTVARSGTTSSTGVPAPSTTLSIIPAR